MRGQRVNDDRVVERPEVKFDYNFFEVQFMCKDDSWHRKKSGAYYLGGTVISTRFSSEVRI